MDKYFETLLDLLDANYENPGEIEVKQPDGSGITYSCYKLLETLYYEEAEDPIDIKNAINLRRILSASPAEEGANNKLSLLESIAYEATTNAFATGEPQGDYFIRIYARNGDSRLLDNKFSKDFYKKSIKFR